MKNKVLLTVVSVLFAGTLYSQQASYFDAAQAYNRLLIEKSNGSYIQIGNYKVIGTPYLYGEKNGGDLFAKGETAYNIYLSYNSYNQTIEFYSSSNPEKSLVKESYDVDSFVLKQNSNSGITQRIKFFNGTSLGAKDKGFYQLMYNGDKFTLYKKYKSVLAIVSTNYIQTELRQFDLNYDYYYFNSETKQLKKLKMTNNALRKEFIPLKDISHILSENNLAANPDLTLNAIFVFLNTQ